MAVSLHDCVSEKDRCGSAAHRRPPESGDGVTTGDPDSREERTTQLAKESRVWASALLCSTFTQLRPPPFYTGRGVREVWEPPPLLAALSGSTRLAWRLHDGFLPLRGAHPRRT